MGSGSATLSATGFLGVTDVTQGGQNTTCHIFLQNEKVFHMKDPGLISRREKVGLALTGHYKTVLYVKAANISRDVRMFV